MSFRLFPDQARDVRGLRGLFRQHRSIVYVLPTGGGKCLRKGTCVLMHDGSTVPVEDLRVGDRLMGPDSRPRTVQRLGRGHGPMVEICPTKGDPWVCNTDHVLTLVRTPDGKPYPSGAGGVVNDVSVTDWLKWSKTKKHRHKLFRVGVEFPEVRLPVDPYLIGLLLGDGTLGKGRVGITTADPEIDAAARGFAEDWNLFLRREQGLENGKAWTLYFTNGRRGWKNQLLSALRELPGMVATSGEKFVPPAYRTSSRAQRLELLAGLIDTDGYLGHQYEYVSKSRRLADDVVFIARSLGLAAYVAKKTVAAGVYWRVSISGDIDIVPVRIPRKMAGLRKQKKNALRTGFTVTPLPPEDFYGFELDGDGRYLLADFTVTHNSVVSGYIAQKLRGNGFKVLILVHRKELVAQFYKTLKELGLSIDVGVVCPGWTPAPWCPIQIGMVFSWARRKPSFQPDFIFVDEAHHIRANSWEVVLAMYPDARVMGMTATPARLDGKGLGTHFETMHEGANPGQLVKLGRLAPVHIKRVPIGFHHTKKKMAGEFNRKEQDRLANSRIVGKAASAYIAHLSGIKTVMFAVSRRHSQETAEALRALGVDAAHIGDDCTDAERDAAVRSFEHGNCMVLCNVGLIDEGFDVKACGAVMDVSHTLSTTKYMQRQGRSRRFLPNKTAILVDLVGNVARHSHPDIARIWSLDDSLDISAPKSSSDRGVNMRMCDQCLTMFQPRHPACPHCGHVHDGRPVVEVDVELIDDYAPPPPPKPKAAPKMTQKQRRALLNDCRYLKRHAGDAAAWEKLRDAAADVGYEPAWAHIMADHLRIPSNARA